MTPVGHVSSLLSQALSRTEGARGASPLGGAGLTDGVRLAPPAAGATGAGFTQMLDSLVATVGAKQSAAGDLTRRVLLGETDQLHQSVIAMQEAGVAFSLMVEVRNKLVESYQELMRLQV